MEHRPVQIWANILTRTKKNEGNIMREINVITISFSSTLKGGLTLSFLSSETLWLPPYHCKHRIGRTLSSTSSMLQCSASEHSFPDRSYHDMTSSGNKKILHLDSLFEDQSQELSTTEIQADLCQLYKCKEDKKKKNKKKR